MNYLKNAHILLKGNWAIISSNKLVSFGSTVFSLKNYLDFIFEDIFRRNEIVLRKWEKGYWQNRIKVKMLWSYDKIDKC